VTKFAVAATNQNEVGCAVSSGWSQPQQIGSLHSALAVTRFRWNEVSRNEVIWDEMRMSYMKFAVWRVVYVKYNRALWQHFCQVKLLDNIVFLSVRFNTSQHDYPGRRRSKKTQLVVWRSGGIGRCMDEVAQRWARLVLRWVNVFGRYTTLVCN